MAVEVTQVGARLALEPGNFLTNADLAIKKMAEISTAAEEMAAKVDTATASMGDSMARTDAKMATAGAAAGGISVADQAALDATAVEQAEARKQAAVEETANAEKKAAADSKSNLDKLASNSTVTKLATFGGGALAVGAYETVKQYTNFNKLVTQSAVDAGAKASDLPQISASLLADSRATGVAAADMANSFYRVQSAMAGTHTSLKNVLKLTSDASKLDVLFNIPAGNATEQTSRVMGAMMYSQLKGATSPDQIMALLNSSVGQGDIRGQDMIGALGKMLPAAKAMGADAPSMMSWVDTLTKSGMQGSQAGTLIAHSVQQLVAPSEQGQKAEQMLGLAPNQLHEVMQKQGIAAAVTLLKTSMKHFDPTSYYPVFGKNAPGPQSALAQLTAWGITDPATQAKFMAGDMNNQQNNNIETDLISKIFGGAKGALPMLALMNSPSGYNDLVNSIKQAASPTKLAASLALAMNTPSRQMQIAKTNIQDTGIQIGQMLTPMAVEGLRALEDVSKYLGQHPAELKGLVVALAGLIGAAVAIKSVKAVSNIVSDIGKLSSATASGGKSILSWLTGGGGSSAAADTGVTAADMQMSAARMQMEAAWENAGLMGGAGGVERTATGAIPLGTGSAGTAETTALGSSIGAALSKAVSGAIAGALAGFVVHYLGDKIIGKHPDSYANTAVNGLSVIAGTTAAGARMGGPVGATLGAILGTGVASGMAVTNLVHQWGAGQKWMNQMNNLAQDKKDPAKFLDAFNNSNGAGAGLSPQVQAYAAQLQKFKVGWANAQGGPAAPQSAWLQMMQQQGYKGIKQTASGFTFTSGPGMPNGNVGMSPKPAPATTIPGLANLLAGSTAPAKTLGTDPTITNVGKALNTANTGLSSAATKQATAAAKTDAAGTKLSDAAKRHQDAAAKLLDAASRIVSAANTLSTTKISATVDTTGLAAQLSTKAATTQARA